MSFTSIMIRKGFQYFPYWFIYWIPCDYALGSVYKEFGFILNDQKYNRFFFPYTSIYFRYIYVRQWTLFLLFFCTGDRSTQLSIGEGQEEWLFMGIYDKGRGGGWGQAQDMSHLLFVDGTLVFCEASQSEMVHIN